MVSCAALVRVMGVCVHASEGSVLVLRLRCIRTVCKRMRICVVLREVVFVAFLTAQMQVKGMFECMGMGRHRYSG